MLKFDRIKIRVPKNGKKSERRNFSLSEIKSVDKKIDAKAEINFQKPFGNENKKKIEKI